MHLDMKPLLLAAPRLRSGQAAVLATAVLASACASTGYTPKPFPIPGSHRTPERAVNPANPASPANAPNPASLANPANLDLYSLVGTALSLRGTPYRNGGSDPAGFDCSGFTQYVFARYGVPLGRGVRDQFQQGQTVDANELAPGDLLFFSTTDPGASHVAIAVGGDEFVHAPSSSGVVRVEHLRSTYWSQRFVGIRRVTPPGTRPF